MAEQSNIYAGVAGYFGKPDHPGKVGVFRRAAGNGNWQHVLGNVQAFTVFVHPKDPETVFAGTNDGVWRSTDRGATFRRTGFPDANRQVWCFMVDSRDARRIFAGASPIDVYRSDDSGANWRKLPTPVIASHCKGPFASRVMRFAQHPRRPDEIYAALEINGVMRSTDGGETWQDCSAGLIKLAELPHLKSKIVSDTTAEGMLDGHAVTINPADPDAAIVALRMSTPRSRSRPRATMAGSTAAPTAARAGSASTRCKCTAPSCRSACTTATPSRSISARVMTARCSARRTPARPGRP